MDIEASVVKFLGERIDCHVSTEVPNPRPEKLITIERTGGSSYLGLDRPTLAVQCWAKTRSQAASLAYEVRDLLDDLDELESVSSVSINSLYNFPTDKNEQRYQIVVNVVCYE